MLLYTLTMKQNCCWVLDLTGPPQGPAERAAPSVYALVVPATPAQVYIGSTKNLRTRIRQHLTRSRSQLMCADGSLQPPRTAAAAVLERVIAGRCGLLVVRLEAVARGHEAQLRRLELAWLLVAAREELPVQRKRGPRLQWAGDPGELKAAFRLARKRRWPGRWIRVLKPLCEHKVLPDPVPIRTSRHLASRSPAAVAPPEKERRDRSPRARPQHRGAAARGEAPS